LEHPQASLLLFGGRIEVCGDTVSESLSRIGIVHDFDGRLCTAKATDFVFYC
jgi:hypothetical protein